MNDTTYAISLDCPPGNPRPAALLIQLIEHTGLNLDPDAPDARPSSATGPGPSRPTRSTSTSRCAPSSSNADMATNEPPEPDNAAATGR